MTQNFFQSDFLLELKASDHPEAYMKLYRLLPLLVLVFLCTANIFSQKFPYEEYDPRTLSDLVQQSAGGINEYKEKQMMIDAKPFYSAVRVTFVGTSRPLTSDKKALYQMWQSSLGIDSKILTLLENESSQRMRQGILGNGTKASRRIFPKRIEGGRPNHSVFDGSRRREDC